MRCTLTVWGGSLSAQAARMLEWAQEPELAVVIYTLRNCPTCDRAMAAMRERGIEFEERRVDDKAEWWDEALKYGFTVPVIVWDNGDVEIGWEGEHG